MESEILKFICANQGAVDTDFLVCNLGCSVSEILSSSDKFVPCCPFGQPKVVARTKLKLCRTKDCRGSCRDLHLCKSFLFSGSCRFTRTSGRCSFSHELNSEHNQKSLREHELDNLSKKELCTLLLQSDNQILPPICHDYNNGHGTFGLCQGGYGCKRVHICERFLNRDCRCSRNHDFRAPQPLGALQGVPEHLIHSLKSAYANIQAMKYQDEKGERGGDSENKAQRRQPGTKMAASGAPGMDAGCSSSQSRTLNPEETSDARGDSQGSQQRKRSGRRRGRGGNWSSHQDGACSMDDLRVAFNVLELMGLDGWE